MYLELVSSLYDLLNVYDNCLSNCRHYRSSVEDTPSHPGGVSDSFKKKSKEKDKREKKKGVHASSKDIQREKDRDRGDLYFFYHLIVSDSLSNCFFL